MSRSEVVRAGEIYLASHDRTTGALLREGRFALAVDQDGRPYPITATLVGLNPPVIAIGEQGRDTQPYASTITLRDCSGGIGVLYHEPDQHTNRVWWATADIRYQRQVTLLKRKIDTGLPNLVTTERPRAGGEFGDKIWVAWNHRVRTYTEANGWSAGAATGDRLLTGSAAPTNNPVEYQGGWFWPLGASGIDVWNGVSWWNIAKPCVALLVYAGNLWIVSVGGVVSSLNLTLSAATVKITATTLAAADFTDRVTVGDVCSDLVMFQLANGNDIVPHVVGERQLYSVDTSGAAPTFIGMPAGPQLPPNQFPIHAAVLGADNALYISQRNGVVQWSGDLARPIGLDSDDGVPIAYRGGIVRLLNGGQSLFALVDATSVGAGTTLALYGSGAFEDGVLAEPLGFSWLASREGEAWVVRAVSDVGASAATALFIAAAERRYRIWYSWGGRQYYTDLEEGLYNPLDDPTGEYEPAGDIYYPVLDFGYSEADKIGVLVQIRTARMSDAVVVTPYVRYEQGSWYPLYNADGTGHGITTDGLHSFLLAANPAPATTNPLAFVDEPPTGHAHHQSQVWLHLTRGTQITATPSVIHMTMHAIKSVLPYTQWAPTLDLSVSVDNRTPWQQRDLLLQFVEDNAAGLLHFAFLAAPDAAAPAGTADVRAVKLTGHSGLASTGLAHTMTGQVRLQLAEVRKLSLND